MTNEDDDWEISESPRIRYADRDFRSPRDARWAAFLDARRIPREYFPSGAATFFLPRAGFYLATRERDPAGFDELDCRDFSGLHRAIFLTGESPGQPPGHAFGTLFCHDLTDSSGGMGEFEAWLLFGRGQLLFVIEGWRDRTYYADPCFTDELNVFQVCGDTGQPKLEPTFHGGALRGFEGGHRVGTRQMRAGDSR